MTKLRFKAYLYLILVAAIWGTAGPVIKYTLQGLDTYTFLTYRFGLSFIASIIIFAAVKTHFPKDIKTLFLLVFWGFITSTVALGLLFLGLEKTTVIDMTILTMGRPILITLAGALLLREHITRREKVGTAITLMGVALTTMEPLIRNHHDGQLMGNGLVALYLLVDLVSTVMAKKLTQKGLSPLLLTGASFIVGFVTMIPLAIFFSPNSLLTLPHIPLSYHLGVIFMALVSGNLAYALWVKGQKSIEISEASLFTYLQVVFSIPIAILWLEEEITFSLLLGALVITIGIAIAEYKKHRPTPSQT